MDRPSEEGAILPKEIEKSRREKEKEYDNYKESNTTCIGPLDDCNHQVNKVDGDG